MAIAITDKKPGGHLKFVAKLTPEEEATLTEAHRNHPSFRVRQWAYAILLNNRKCVAAWLGGLFGAQHETVSSWLDKWEAGGLMGIYDCPRSGRPARFTAGEQADFLGYIDENPHQPKAAAARLVEKTGKEAGHDAFKRILIPTRGTRKSACVWKRCRQSVKGKRGEADFRRDKECLEALKQQEDGGELMLYYFDEPGSSAPCGYQHNTLCALKGWRDPKDTLPSQQAHECARFFEP